MMLTSAELIQAGVGANKSEAATAENRKKMTRSFVKYLGFMPLSFVLVIEEDGSWRSFR